MANTPDINHPRIDPATPPFAPDIQRLFQAMMPDGQAPIALFTTLARDPRLFKKFIRGGLLDEGNLTLRQRELIIDRVTAQCGSEYEWGVHVAGFNEQVALTEEQLHSLVHGDHTDNCWEEQDRLLIRLCDELHTTCRVSAPLWSQLNASFKDEALLEMIMLCGFYRMVSYLTNATELPLEPSATRFPAK